MVVGTRARSCIDLREQSSWRVYQSEDHVAGTSIDPWDLELRGPRGSTVYPFGGDYLCAQTTRSGMWKRLRRLGEVHQQGDKELVVRFRVDELERVADLLQIYRRRWLPTETLLKRFDASSLAP